MDSGDALLPYTANEDVLRGQVVKIQGEDNGVGPSDTDGEAVLGVATQTVSAGDQVTVAMPGCEVILTSGTGTVTRGDVLASHGATGEEGEVDTAATGDYGFAVALEDDAGANDDVRAFITGVSGQVN